MGGTEKSLVDKYKNIINDWHYNASCTLISLAVLDLETFQRSIFVA